LEFAIPCNENSWETVTVLDANQVRSSVKRLSKARSALFGADAHRFILNPPLGENEVRAFEELHHISLPADYRHFVTHISNGGAGPYYGVFPLGQWDGTGNKLNSWNEKDGFIGVLSEPFPLRDAWNDLCGQPSGDLIDTNLEEYERQLAAFEKIYWDTARVNGAFPICHLGCALRIWLVVSGDEKGHLWLDRRADDQGLSPLTLKNRLRATFSTWYQEWLDDALQSLA
jgi:hypothetical protein